MKVIDPGHKFELDSLDGEFKNILQFVKREGEHYPGNIGHYPGTTIQEVLRASISRLEHVNRQIPCLESEMVVDLLKSAITLLEIRAKRVKGKYLTETRIVEILQAKTCKMCGHVSCMEENHDKASE